MPAEESASKINKMNLMLEANSPAFQIRSKLGRENHEAYDISSSQKSMS